MKRLTERDEFGHADIIGVDSADFQQNLGYRDFNRVTDALDRLASYEEMTGLLPEEIAARMDNTPSCPDDCRWRQLHRYHKCTSCARSRNRPDNYLPGTPAEDVP